MSLPTEPKRVLILSLGDLFPYNVRQSWAALPMAYNAVELLFRGVLSGALSRLDAQFKLGIQIGADGDNVPFTFQDFYDGVRACFAFANDDIAEFRQAWNAGLTLDKERVQTMLSFINDSVIDECHIVSDTNSEHWARIEQWCRENEVILPENIHLSFQTHSRYAEMLFNVTKEPEQNTEFYILRHHSPTPSAWNPLNLVMGRIRDARVRDMDEQHQLKPLFWEHSCVSLQARLAQLRLEVEHQLLARVDEAAQQHLAVTNAPPVLHTTAVPTDTGDVVEVATEENVEVEARPDSRTGTVGLH